jgi:hypothetical protein
MSKPLTFSAAKTVAATFGWTIKRTGANDLEVMVYQTGTKPGQHAYFTEYMTDALDTARAEHSSMISALIAEQVAA